MVLLTLDGCAQVCQRQGFHQVLLGMEQGCRQELGEHKTAQLSSSSRQTPITTQGTIMVSRALPILLLCLLLLLQAQGHFRRRKTQARPQGSKANFTVPPRVIGQCKKHVSTHLCSYHCQHDMECQANKICCTAFCGNVCMSILE
ncbi:protein WFDC10B-like isoform X2 [Talpa occidentalis]|nr:protein WFDC10B-like isoform X2 [Talpa occidentalis]